jgi:hypothetical protein
VLRDVQSLEPVIEDRQQTGNFTLFPQLPRELRLLIWEHSWPPPRLIEVAAYFPSPNLEAEHWELGDGDAETGHAILRPLGSLSRALKEDLVARAMDEEPLEEFQSPVALQVCQESRMYTQKHYVLLSHSYTLAGSFYLSHIRDVLYLSLQYMRSRQYSEALQEALRDSYPDKLDGFATVLVEDITWEKLSPTEYTTIVLAAFKSLKTTRILFIQKHHFNTSALVGYSDDAPMNDEQVHEYANRLRAEYAKACLDHPEWRSTTLEVMDRNGKIF